MKTCLPFASLLLFVISLNGYAVPEKILPHPGGSGKFTSLVWQDEFDGTGLPSDTKWSYEEGYVRNHEIQYYTQSRLENVFQANGILHLRLLNDSATVGGGVRPVTSASIMTKGKGDWKYGRIEVRAKLPLCLGSWPAIWMMPTFSVHGGWPKSGEIDIMEHVGFMPEKLHFTIHREKGSRGTAISLPDVTDDFHIYALEWSKDKLDWYVDGQNVFSLSGEGEDWESWPYNESYYLILNFAFGGTWGGQQGIDLSSLPQEYLLDYVRVFQ